VNKVTNTDFKPTSSSGRGWSVIQVNLWLQSTAVSAVIPSSVCLAAAHGFKVMARVGVHVPWRVQELKKVLPQIKRQRTKEVHVHRGDG